MNLLLFRSVGNAFHRGNSHYERHRTFYTFYSEWCTDLGFGFTSTQVSKINALLFFVQLILFIQAFKQTVQRPLKRYFRSPWTAKWSDTLRLISLLPQIFFLENPWNQFTTLSIIHYETHTWILASESDKIITFFSFPTGAYYCLNMIMITLSTFLAVIVIHLYFRGPRTNRVPYWVKRVRNK